jgi:hypothetical protein
MFFTVPWGVNFSTRGDSWAQGLRFKLRKERKKERRTRAGFIIISPYLERVGEIKKALTVYPNSFGTIQHESINLSRG